MHAARVYTRSHNTLSLPLSPLSLYQPSSTLGPPFSRTRARTRTYDRQGRGTTAVCRIPGYTYHGMLLLATDRMLSMRIDEHQKCVSFFVYTCLFILTFAI